MYPRPSRALQRQSRPQSRRRVKQRQRNRAPRRLGRRRSRRECVQQRRRAVVPGVARSPVSQSLRAALRPPCRSVRIWTKPSVPDSRARTDLLRVLRGHPKGGSAGVGRQAASEWRLAASRALRSFGAVLSLRPTPVTSRRPRSPLRHHDVRCRRGAPRRWMTSLAQRLRWGGWRCLRGRNRRLSPRFRSRRAAKSRPAGLLYCPCMRSSGHSGLVSIR